MSEDESQESGSDFKQKIELIDRLFMEEDFAQCQKLLQLDRVDFLEQWDLNAEVWYYLRLGQVLYELEEYEESKERLTKAFNLDGFKLFEEEDPKYLHHIQAYTAQRVLLYRISLFVWLSSFFAMFAVPILLKIKFNTIPGGWIAAGFIWLFSMFFVVASLSPYPNDSLSNSDGGGIDGGSDFGGDFD